MAQRMTVGELLKERGEAFQLTIVAGEAGLDHVITTGDLNRPSLALAGFYEHFSWERIQVIGVTEHEYLSRTERRLRTSRIERMFGFAMPCIIVTTSVTPVPELTMAAQRHGLPLIVSRLTTSELCKRIGSFLEMRFAPRTQMHAGLVEVFGMGVLLLGQSGVGKSECALELVERGHRLVADDIVVLRRLPLDRLVGTSNSVLRHHMEVRGLGIIDVEALFGAGSVRDLTDVDVVVRLEKWDRTKHYERLGFETPTMEVLGVRIPFYTLPIEPGRNISILVEVAAIHQRLKNTGRNPADAFEANLMNVLRNRGAATLAQRDHLQWRLRSEGEPEGAENGASGGGSEGPRADENAPEL
jgi:HPr kinase/phosphorylase